MKSEKNSRPLIDAKSELRNYGHKVVEDIGLFLFIDSPGLFAGEEIYLDRKSVGCGLFLSHDDIKTLIYIGMMFQVPLDV